MLLKSLYLRNFRNFEKAEISFSSKANLIHGLNAQGKTNLLEAIYFLSTGRSFRTLHLNELIQHEKPHFYLEAHFEKEGIPQEMSIFFDGTAKKVKYNQTTYNNLSQLLGLLPTVLYTPQDIALILGAPAIRRRFLDLHIAQVDPLYVHHLVRYFKALKQRNCLLRQKSIEGIEVWEKMMSISARYITEKRGLAIDELNISLKNWMHRLSPQEEPLAIAYKPILASEELYLEQRKKELAYGNSLIGPHRDDLSICISEHAAKYFSSEGQKRCAIAALKLAEWERLYKITGTPPLMSIDDFGIHLDPQRHTLFQAEIERLGQVFITTPLEIKNLLHSQYIRIENGTIFI